MADFNELWQENKGFALAVGGGLALFLLGETAIGYLYRDERDAALAQIRNLEKELKKPLANRSNLESIEGIDEKLRKGISEVEGKAQFEVSAEYRLADGGASPENQYFDIVTRTREKLIARAHRNNIEVPEHLGLPNLSPTNKEDIRLYLQGLDLAQRVISMGIEKEITRVDGLRVELPTKGRRKDPKAGGKGGPATEEVRVWIKAMGSGPAIASWIESALSGAKPLLVEKAKLSAAPKGDLLVAEIEFSALRLLGEEAGKVAQ